VTVVVRPATTAEILDVRLGVLRPTVPRVPNPRDHDPVVVHIGAFDGTRAVGCVTVHPDPDPVHRLPAAWRMRGMAVEPAYQGLGIGRQVLEAATAAAEAAGSPLLWANGRVSALEFYDRLGWEPVGPVFAHGPDYLPHRVILRWLDASAATGSAVGGSP
jgi:GNAT superfamily N-acetyltransferase